MKYVRKPVKTTSQSNESKLGAEPVKEEKPQEGRYNAAATLKGGNKVKVQSGV